MITQRTRAYRREQRRLALIRKNNKPQKHPATHIPADYEKNFGLIYFRRRKLKRAKQLGMLWPAKEKVKYMADNGPLNILFVCSMNQWRSPTGEKTWAKDPRVNTRSAGTSRKAKRTISVNDIRWADLILVMEDKHKSRIQADFRGEVLYKDLQVLDIPDNYQYMDEELVQILVQKVEALLH